MNKRITFITFLLFFVIVFSSIIQAQVNTLWTKTIGGIGTEGGSSVQQTTDGGYIITGGISTIEGNSIWLIKTNASGDTLWTKTFEACLNNYDRSVQQTIDGGYIIVGHTYSWGPIGYYIEDIWLIKTNVSGNTLWTKTFGGSRAEYGSSVQQTTDGGYVIVGSTESFSTPFRDIWLIKTNAFGDTLWTKIFGGSDDECGTSVQQTTDEGYILTGDINPTGEGSSIWLIKTNVSGETLWTKIFGGDRRDQSMSVQQTTDGGYIIVGHTDSFGSGGWDIWLIKTNVSGDTLWTKTFGKSSFDYSSSVQQTTDGGYIIVGTTYVGGGNTDVWLIKTNASGDTLWTKTFGGSSRDSGSSVQQTTDGGYIIVGTLSVGGGNTDVWLIKTTSEGTKIEQNDDIVTLDYDLTQNYPNPFNPKTTIEFSIPKSKFATLKIFNILGEEVATLVSDRLSAGSYSYEWDGSQNASGVYMYRLKAGNYVETRKMVLMK